MNFILTISLEYLLPWPFCALRVQQEYSRPSSVIYRSVGKKLTKKSKRTLGGLSSTDPSLTSQFATEGTNATGSGFAGKTTSGSRYRGSLIEEAVLRLHEHKGEILEMRKANDITNKDTTEPMPTLLSMPPGEDILNDGLNSWRSSSDEIRDTAVTRLLMALLSDGRTTSYSGTQYREDLSCAIELLFPSLPSLLRFVDIEVPQGLSGSYVGLSGIRAATKDYSRLKSAIQSSNGASTARCGASIGDLPLLDTAERKVHIQLLAVKRCVVLPGDARVDYDADTDDETYDRCTKHPPAFLDVFVYY